MEKRDLQKTPKQTQSKHPMAIKTTTKNLTVKNGGKAAICCTGGAAVK